MVKLTKKTAFKTSIQKAETPMEKTTRVVRKIVDEEAEKRHAKNVRLRTARLEREAHTPTKDISDALKSHAAKPTTKRG